MSHPVYFVGAGPGDPELITVKGKRLIQEADRIVYAGSLVPEALLADRKPTAMVVNSASLNLQETHLLLKEGHAGGELVVRLHTGDPSLYGAIQEQMSLLDREAIPHVVVPGVSAVFAAAAELGQELTLPEVSQTVIVTRLAGRTPVPEKEAIRSLAMHQATLVIYLSVNQIDKLVEEISPFYPAETPVVVACRVSWPDQVIIEGELSTIASRVKDAGIERQALIMVGAVFGARSGGDVKRSKLYDASFEHGFRKARPSR